LRPPASVPGAPTPALERAPARRCLETPRALGPSLALIAALCLSGCYNLGVEPVEGAATLAVPIFANRTLRREYEHALTRNVRREVLETTPLHLASEATADLVLRGNVQEVQEGVLIPGPNDEVLRGSVTVTATFSVFDQAGARVVGEDADADGSPESDYTRLGYAEYSSANGESRDTAAEEALRDIAEMIVQELTARRDDRFEPNDEAAQATTLAPGRQLALIQRDPDWFRLAVPPGLTLHVTLFAPEGAFAVELRGRGGELLPDAVLADDGRTARVTAGAEPRPVLVRVIGDDSGRRYQLLVRLAPGP
jgi:hypothetical protein